MKPNRVTSHKRAGIILLYLVGMLPVQLFTLGLIVDIGRVVYVQHSLGNVADSVAMAAASKFTSTGAFNQGEGRVAAVETFTMARSVGMVPNINLSSVELKSVDFPNPKAVTVSINYKMNGMLILAYFTGPDQGLNAGVIRRSAQVCNPQVDVCPYPV